MSETANQNSSPVVCEYCQSTNVRKYGLVKDVQHYFCNECEGKFTVKEAIVVEWPKDFLLPIIDREIVQLLRYLTRDSSWQDCFGVQVRVDGIAARLNRDKAWKKLLQGPPEVTGDYVAELVALVALSKGLAVLHKGTQIVMTERADGETQNNHK